MMSGMSSQQVPFVGREHEIELLLGAVDRAASGDPRAVIIGGDAGVGKSRLLDRVAALATDRGATVVVGHCIDFGGTSLPYLPVIEALTDLRRRSDGVDRALAERPALARVLDGGVGEEVDDATARLQLFDGVAAAITGSASADRPLVVVLEDIHWADPSTLDVLRFLIARMRNESVTLLVSYRADDVHRRHRVRPILAELHRHPRVDRIDLRPFDARELRAFADAIAPDMSALDVEELLRRSEGNAYFAEELIDASGAVSLPRSLSDVLRSRIEQLEAPVARLAAIASVSGRRVPEDLLKRIAESDPVLRAHGGGASSLDALLHEAVARHVLLVDESGHIVFRHALLAEVVYGDLLPGERSALHRAYLGALASVQVPGAAAARAHHALHAHDLRAAAIASHEAAAEAERMLAPQEALRHHADVLALWDSVPDLDIALGADRVDVLLRAATAASTAGDPLRGVAFATAASEAVGLDDVRRPAVVVAIARHLLAADRIEAAFDTTVSALAELPDDASVERAWTYATAARAALNLDRDEQAAHAATAAVAMARAVAAPGAEADALVTLAVLEVDDGDRSATLLEEARETARRAGDLATELRCWYNLTANRYYEGHLAEAAELAAAGVARADEAGIPWTEYAIGLRELAGLVRYTLGDLTASDDPDGVPSTIVEVLRGVASYAAVARGDDALTTGSTDDILARLSAAQGDAQDANVHIVGGCTIDALTRVGRPDDAVTVGLELIGMLKRAWDDYFLGSIWLSALTIAALADIADARRTRGHDVADLVNRGAELLADAETTAERGRPRGGRLGPEGVAWLQRARAEYARLENSPSAVASWLTTVAAFDYGYPYEVARSRHRLAEALVMAGDTDEAARVADAALAQAEAMGASPLVDALTAFVRRARLPVAGSRRTVDGVLTAREADVLALAAQGLTNRQIGAALFISPKTVSVHLSNVFAKIGASTRTEAVAVAHDRGLLTAGRGAAESVPAATHRPRSRAEHPITAEPGGSDG
jgi:DNA-binding CsgD family transcriptional regulator